MSFHLDEVSDQEGSAAACPPSNWYAVYTYSRHEKSVKDYMNAKTVEVFLPTVATQRRWRDRNMQLNLPAFPGYVFVRLPLHERGKVLSTPGVVRILSFNGAPAPIDNAEVEALRMCLERSGRLEPHPFLQIGERGRVRDGALKGLEGLVIRKKGACRLVLSIALIHQAVAVEIDASLLEPVDPMTRVARGTLKSAGLGFTCGLQSALHSAGN
jgi:transcription antitermination factor NusG